jgi:hypothetical protein
LVQLTPVALVVLVLVVLVLVALVIGYSTQPTWPSFNSI